MINNYSDNAELVDLLGRRITYLRVSLTGRCNFRCRYCYGTENSRRSRRAFLTDEELIKLIEAAALLGVDKIRLTGGEPLLRPSLARIVRRISRIKGNRLVGLTTNGYLLAPKLQSLIDAGLTRLNVSIDSLNRETFRWITGRDGLHQVLKAVNMAELSGVFPWVKVNMVIMRGVNDSELNNFANWALERKIDLRFIEYMPAQNTGWGMEKFISEEEFREKLRLNLEPDNDKSDIQGPARRFRMKGYPGRVSFISAVSRGFCRTCNRLRLTSSGELLGCLFRDNRVSLLPVVREKRTVDEIADFIRRVVSGEEFRKMPDACKGDFRPLMKAIGG